MAQCFSLTVLSDESAEGELIEFEFHGKIVVGRLIGTFDSLWPGDEGYQYAAIRLDDGKIVEIKTKKTK